MTCYWRPYFCICKMLPRKVGLGLRMVYLRLRLLQLCICHIILSLDCIPLVKFQYELPHFYLVAEVNEYFIDCAWRLIAHYNFFPRCERSCYFNGPMKRPSDRCCGIYF